jgi:chemotaxis signal transduction protein
MQRYGIAARFVGEVVSVTSVTPVPLAPASVLGVFNLRGAPVALVDLYGILSVSEQPTAKRQARTEAGGEAGIIAMVLATEALSVAARIDAMEGVLTLNSSDDIVRSAEADPLVMGFLEDPSGGVVTILNDLAVFERLEELRLRK